MGITKPVAQTRREPEVRSAAAVEVERADLHRQITELTAQVDQLELQLEALHRSTSWRVTAPLRWLGRHLRRMPSISPNGEGAQVRTYAEWVRRYDSLGTDRPSDLCPRIVAQAERPLLSVIVWGSGEDLQLLVASVSSMLEQIYDRWELILMAGAEGRARVDRAMPKAALADTRVRLSVGHSSKADALNVAIDLASADWVVLLEAGGILPPYALCHLAHEIHGHPETQVVYADDDVIDTKGVRTLPRFKPDWDPELFNAKNLLRHLFVVSKALARRADAFREGLDGAEEYDLLLRCTEGLPAAQVRRVPRVLCHRLAIAPSGYRAKVAESEARALAAHFERAGTAVDIVASGDERRVRYHLPSAPPMVTLIIPTRNQLFLVRQCIESIVTATTYPNYEILLVDNGSDEPDALAYFAELQGQAGITVIRDDRPFNFSALNNLAATRARGEVLALVNNDIEAISPDWLEEMVSLALQPGIGAVGAKLLYPDGTAQHAGVVLGIGGIAGHVNRFLPAREGGYMNRALTVQSFSAVTGACLVVRKALYDQVGGLNEVDLKIAYNDVDFCLRLREAGYRNVWTPHAVLLHHESATRGSDLVPEKRHRFEQEQAYMRSRWPELIADDPAYNPNLTVHAEDFGLAWPPRVPWIVDSEGK